MGLLKKIGRSVERRIRPLVKQGVQQGFTAVGTYFGGPVGGMVGSQIGSSLIQPVGRGAPAGPAYSTQPLKGGGGGASLGVSPAAYYSNGTAPTGRDLPAPRSAGVPAVMTGVVYILVQAAARLGITRLTLAMAMAILRKFGIVAGATLLTMSAQEALLVWLAGTKRPRRRKGITARDVRTVSRAQSIVRRAQRLADTFPSTRGPARRRRTKSHAVGCGCVVCKRS